MNFNCCILDCAPVTIGNRVLFAPNVQVRLWPNVQVRFCMDGFCYLMGMYSQVYDRYDRYAYRQIMSLTAV